jgi:hypothetical protein
VNDKTEQPGVAAFENADINRADRYDRPQLVAVKSGRTRSGVEVRAGITRVRHDSQVAIENPAMFAHLSSTAGQDVVRAAGGSEKNGGLQTAAADSWRL